MSEGAIPIEDMYRLLAESNVIGIGVGDANGGVHHVNDEMLRLMGRSREMFEAGQLNWRDALAPECLAAAEQALAKTEREGSAKGIEKVFVHPDGSRVHFLSSGAQLGQSGLHISIAIDLTARKNAEDALKDADRRKDEFLATLAHELRNPLAPIRSSLELLSHHGIDEETASRARAIMERQVAHMVGLVDDLLDVSRIGQGHAALNRRPEPLARIVRQALETSRPILQAAGHSVTVDLPGDSLIVEADPLRLVQVFANLLNNAAKFTAPGGKIHVAATADGKEALVRVEDSGEGIAPDMLDDVFTMFTQVSPSRKRQGGLGIGLTLVRQLVEMHGGRVRADSAGPGQGSTFSVWIPLPPDAG